MERWSVAECRTKDGPVYYLTNSSRTIVKVSGRAKRFDLQKLLKALKKVDFPLSFTNGLSQINLIIFNKAGYGWYEDDEIFIDVKSKHWFRTIVDTFVHEVAHHIDYSSNKVLSEGQPALTRERKRRGNRIHKIAGQSDEEYFARGFERYYSIDPKKKEALRIQHPALYARIDALHDKHKSKRKIKPSPAVSSS